MTNPEMVALTALPRELAALTGATPPTYRKVWSMVVDGIIPAERVDAGRYHVKRADLPAIVTTLGMRVKDAAPRAPARKPASSLVAA